MNFAASSRANLATCILTWQKGIIERAGKKTEGFDDPLALIFSKGVNLTRGGGDKVLTPKDQIDPLLGAELLCCRMHSREGAEQLRHPVAGG